METLQKALLELSKSFIVKPQEVFDKPQLHSSGHSCFQSLAPHQIVLIYNHFPPNTMAVYCLNALTF